MLSFSFVVVSKHLFQPFSLSGGDRWVSEGRMMFNPETFPATFASYSTHNVKTLEGFTAWAKFDRNGGGSHGLSLNPRPYRNLGRGQDALEPDEHRCDKQTQK